MRHRLTTIAAAVLTGLLALAGTAAAQQGLDVRLTDSALAEDGTTELVVAVTGAAAGETVLEPGAFTVTEQGETVPDLSATPLLESQASPVTVALVVDRSGSTQGAPLDAAKAATRDVVQQLSDQGITVGVFSFGETATLDAAFGSDPAAALAAVDALTADGETAMYDAVRLAARALGEQAGQRHLLLFSDGGDTVSGTTLEQAVAASTRRDVSVRAVALQTPEIDRGALDRLASATDGSVVPVGDAGGLSGAFESVTREIASQYVLTYTGSVTDTDELDVAVTAAVGGASATDTARLPNPRIGLAAERPAADVPEPGLLGSEAGLWVGVAATFAALALLFLLLVWSRPTRGTETLRRALRTYTRGEGTTPAHRDGAVTNLTARATRLVERFPKPEGFEERLQLDIDRAGWSLRAAEFLTLQASTAVAGLALGWSLTGGLLLAFVLSAVGALVPRVVLTRKVRDRQTQFLEQLPDTLGMIAGSLRAGYGLVQAIDTVVKEAPSPTGEEFARTLTENRLGRPMDEALEGMAERLGNEDFAWVVMAINIQHEVGGNLAELLEMVAETLRSRARLHRQVNVLTAEGRLSMWILLALPPSLVVMMTVVNPDYISQLWTTVPGLVMVVASVVLNMVGYLWMRRLIAIEV